MTAPARPNHVFHGLKKPEIAYLPTACAETLPFLPRTVLSCYHPYMGWQSWRFEGQTFESPHILVYDMARGFIPVMARLDPANPRLRSGDPRIALGLRPVCPGSN